MSKKTEAIEKLNTLKTRAQSLFGKNDEHQDFKKWKRDTEIAIERIFGSDQRHIKDFHNISFYPGFSLENSSYEIQTEYKSGVESSITLIDSFIDEINDYWSDDNIQKDKVIPEKNIQLIIKRFHKVARQIRDRHGNRPTLDIDDEYDVQDLFHALLKLYFDDVREEEYTPSYAGAASRVDFLLKQEKIIIEIKKTRKSLSAKQVGEELMVDSQRYQSHPDCEQLICFVYDPDARIANPKGLEKDLTKELNGVPISVFITPDH